MRSSFLLAALVSVLDSLAFWVVILCGLYLLYIITVLSNEVNSAYGGISNRIDHKTAAEHPHTRQA
jgi:hypothetical protein